MECFIQQVFAGIYNLPSKKNITKSPCQLPLAKFWKTGWSSDLSFWLSSDPPHSAVEAWTRGLSHCSPTSLTPTYLYTLDAPIYLSLSPLSSFFLSLLLGLIKKHLLAIHCISEQNLYFRHVEPWILNLNINVGRIPRLLHQFYLSVITPSRIQHADRCKWTTKNAESQEQQKEIGWPHLLNKIMLR